MQLECSVLGKDIEITDSSIPVISPYWRLRRNGDWTLLCRYAVDGTGYSRLSPEAGATLALMDGRLAFRHLCILVQYAHDFATLEESQEFVFHLITEVNKECDAIVQMRPELEPYVKKLDPIRYVTTKARWGQQKRPAVPVSLNLMLSNDCETNCTYCHANRRYVPESQLLSTKRWREILREARGLGIEQVTLSGGDPLFRRDALALIEELICQEMLFTLSTKCYITEEIADRLVQIGMARPLNQYVREIQLKVDGPDESTADRMAGSPGHYSRAVQSIRNLLERGFNLRVKAVVTPITAAQVYQWISNLAGMGVARISLAGCNPTYSKHTPNLFLSNEDRMAILEQCNRARLDFPEMELSLIGFEVSGEETSSRAKTRTGNELAQWHFGPTSMTITPDGKAIVSDADGNEKAPFAGDVTHQTILEIWNREATIESQLEEMNSSQTANECADNQKRKDEYCLWDSYRAGASQRGEPGVAARPD